MKVVCVEGTLSLVIKKCFNVIRANANGTRITKEEALAIDGARFFNFFSTETEDGANLPLAFLS